MFLLMVMGLKKILSSNIVVNVENNGTFQAIKIPVFFLSVVILSLGLIGRMNMNHAYFNDRIEMSLSHDFKRCEPVSYESESLIRDNYSFNDVYFSFTEFIDANPPEYLAISKKLIYKIDTASQVYQKFPNLDPNARVLFVLNKDDSIKSDFVLEQEKYMIENSKLLFSSHNFAVYAYNKEYL
ncbi:hypothetical protein FACS1894161_4310 [Spirochaetia bacterium]|nr:hypothetical protein FACS1894161_4310 [Spirochaetia bacterium]